MSAQLTRQQYWRKMLQRISILLAVWFLCGYVMSIFLIEPLNAFSFGGVPFGFWMAQQGSIFVFVSLIFIFAYFGDKLDREAGVAEEEGTTSGPAVEH